jgi:hypothetical protein
MMEETLQICGRAQRSTQDASHRKPFPFGLWPPSDAYARQVEKSIQIQSGRHQPSDDLKVETRACHDPLDVPCIYHKGARHTLHGRRLRKKIDQERDTSRTARLPHLRTTASFRRPGSASPPTARDVPSGASWWFRRTTHRGLARQIQRRRVGSKPT